MAASAAPKSRDAARSREAILDAAERLYAARGFDGVSLHQIGSEAGLSRGTPSYFFGSKEELYTAVLARSFASREEAVRDAFDPVMRWAQGEDDLAALRRALTKTTSAYMTFLLGHPGYVGLIAREGVDGGARLREVPRESSAVSNAFSALRKAGSRRGIRSFLVDDLVLLFISLTFLPVSHRATFMVTLKRDLDDPAVLRRHVRLVVDTLWPHLSDA